MSTYQTSPRPKPRRLPSTPGAASNSTPKPSQPLELVSTPGVTNSGPSNLFPPDYNSIKTPSASAVQASQASRNLEKQALRDAWREQADQLAQVRSRNIPHISGPPSIEPSSHSNSNSDSSGNNGVGLGISGAELSLVQSNASASVSAPRRQSREIGRRGILPEGMDVREALAKCEDPTLGWSLQFWVTIADPVTQHVFFACPASGQCSWDPPVGAFVVPRSPDGEWWELADATRSNRSYYYNTLTGKTQWTRPGGDAFVIPLGLIQSNALPSRNTSSGHASARSSTVPAPTHLSPHAALTTPPRNRDRTSTLPGQGQTPRGANVRPPLSPRTSSGPRISSPMASPPPVSFPEAHPTGSSSRREIDSRQNSLGSDSHSARRVPSDPISLASQSSGGTNVPWTPLSIVDEGSGTETDRDSEADGGKWWERRRSKPILAMKIGSPRKAQTNALFENQRNDVTTSRGTSLAQVDSRLSNRRDSDVPRPVLTDDSVLPKNEPAEPIFVESAVRSKRLSTGWHPILADDLSSEIQNFQTDEFANKYFATKRAGILRQRVPLERIMEWQKSPITAPLLNLPKNFTKYATTTFKVIQHVMGERDRPVESARPVHGSSSASNIQSLNLAGRKNDEGHPDRNGRLANGFSNGSSGNVINGEGRSEKMVILEEIRWMIQLGATGAEMRDEIYSQLVKQLTKNPDPDASVLGFQLLCVLVNGFGPSKEFTTYVKSFLQRNTEQKADGIGVMAKYCLAKLIILATKGGRGKVLTVGEIEHASDSAFYPSIYGESLDRIMQLQASSYPNLMVPVILPFLADGILALGGTQSEGIFRVPGDADSVSELKSRMDRGHYQLDGIDDPHVAASLFKLWLRELEEPVVPSVLYNEALACSTSPGECIDFVTRLPTYNRRVLLFAISFFQQFMREEVVELTKMTPPNLALILAPNILRTTSNHLETVFTNSSFESRFVLQLLENLRPREIDNEYVPTHGPAVESGRMDRGYHREI